MITQGYKLFKNMTASEIELRINHLKAAADCSDVAVNVEDGHIVIQRGDVMFPLVYSSWETAFAFLDGIRFQMITYLSKE